MFFYGNALGVFFENRLTVPSRNPPLEIFAELILGIPLEFLLRILQKILMEIVQNFLFCKSSKIVNYYKQSLHTNLATNGIPYTVIILRVKSANSLPEIYSGSLPGVPFSIFLGILSRDPPEVYFQIKSTRSSF